MDKNEERIWDSIVVSAKQLIEEARKILDSIPAGAGTDEKYVASVRADPAVFADSIMFLVIFDDGRFGPAADKILMDTAVADMAVGYQASLVVKCDTRAALAAFLDTDDAWQEISDNLYHSYFTLMDDDVIY